MKTMISLAASALLTFAFAQQDQGSTCVDSSTCSEGETCVLSKHRTDNTTQNTCQTCGDIYDISQGIYGLTFVRDATVGLSSYHFVQGGSYVDFSNIPSQSAAAYLLKDGSAPPDKVFFEEEVYDKATNTFTAKITWGENVFGLDEYEWRFSMIFNDDLTKIISGSQSSFDSAGNAGYNRAYQQLLYYNNYNYQQQRNFKGEGGYYSEFYCPGDIWQIDGEAIGQSIQVNQEDDIVKADVETPTGPVTICEAPQILGSDGTCQNCPIQTKPDITQTSCVSDSCNTTTQVLDIDGSCIERSEFLANSRPQENAFRTKLKLVGSIELMETTEQKEQFKQSVASMLAIDLSQITILDVFAGSINIIYDIQASDAGSFASLQTQQAENFATDFSVLGLPITSAEISTPDGLSQPIVEDGTLVASSPLLVNLETLTVVPEPVVETPEPVVETPEPVNIPDNLFQTPDAIVDDPVVETIFKKRNIVINVNIYKFKECHYSNQC